MDVGVAVMDPTGIAVLLIVVGILMLIAEVTIPGFFIAIPGTVLLVLGVVGLMAPWVFYSTWTPVFILAVGVPTFIVTIMFYMKFGPTSPPVTTVASSLVGKTGVVTKEVRPDSLRGKVKIGSDVWSATSNRAIPAGTRVRVVRSEGVHVIVEPVEEAKEEGGKRAEENIGG